MITWLFVVASLAACKDTGTVQFDIDTAACPVEPTAATVQMFAVEADRCLDGCALPTCGERCTWICEDGCPADEPVDFVPPAGGTYGVYVRYHDTRGALLAAGCAQATFDADGTASKRVVVTLSCCQ